MSTTADGRYRTATPEEVAKAELIRKTAKSKLGEYAALVMEDCWVAANNSGTQHHHFDLRHICEAGQFFSWLPDRAQNEQLMALLREKTGTPERVAPEPAPPQPEMKPAGPPAGSQLTLF